MNPRNEDSPQVRPRQGGGGHQRVAQRLLISIFIPGCERSSCWAVKWVWILALAGCAHPAPTPPAHEAAKHAIDPWVLACYDPQATEPALLWNGRIGLRLGRDGGPTGPAGALPMFAIDSYEPTGEEKIERYNNPLGAPPSIEGVQLSLDRASDYSQRLDMRTGALVTAWTQSASDGRSIQVGRTVVLHPDQPVIAERWQFSGPDLKTIPEEHRDVFPPVRTGQATLRVGQGTFTLTPKPGSHEPAKMEFDTVMEVERQSGPAREKPLESFDQVLADSKHAWSERWKTDILIDGPVEDQQAIRSWLFYLRSAVTADPQAPVCISPYGLSNNIYNGHVFWDADISVFPALALIDPDEAKTIPKYRLAKLDQAATNYKDWVAKGKPADKYHVPGPSPKDGIKFPWESGVSGKETMPGPSRFEDHVTGSVAFSLSQAASLGLIPESEAQRVIVGADAFYQARSEPGPNGREIKRTLSPDENQVANNDLYTNLLAEWTHDGGGWQGHIDTLRAATTYKLPRDSRSFLTYDNDALMSYQQTAAVLSIYPLQYPPAEKEAKQMMERFAFKVSPFGPAMSDSLHAVIWSRLGETDRAYEAWRKGWQPFMAGPLGLFSERRAVESTYFVTGAAGSLQSVLYGFLGIRIDSHDRSDDAWSKTILGGRVLSVKPHLPKAWKSVKFQNFNVLGRHYTLVESRTPKGVSTHITQGD